MASNENHNSEKPHPAKRAARSPAKPHIKPATAPQRAPDAGTPEGERIAKVLSRRGIASRREAERMIELGEISVNGKTISSPALNVTPSDRITVQGHPLPAEEPARVWLYYKPEGLVTSESDEKGRDTVFANLPPDMPRVMSVGRLDLNSEGLLLLTNDGALKRRLELPSTGWLRKYRVRVNGNPTDVDLDPLRRGITVEGERFQPMIVSLDRIQGANAWLTVGLREGRNREIRRALNAIDLYVNRLIRVSYGPFRLGELQPGEVEEIRGKVLRDQLGAGADDDEPSVAKTARTPAKPAPGKGTLTRVRSRDADTARGDAAKPAPKPSGRKPREGDGLRALSDTFHKALKPAAYGAGAAKPAAKSSRPQAGTAKPTAKPTARPTSKPGPKPTKPGAPRRPK